MTPIRPLTPEAGVRFPYGPPSPTLSSHCPLAVRAAADRVAANAAAGKRLSESE